MQIIFLRALTKTLPHQLRLSLRKNLSISQALRRLPQRLKIKGIAEVEYGEQFLNSIHSIKGMAKAGSLSLIIIMSAGVIFVCYSTIKIAFTGEKKR